MKIKDLPASTASTEQYESAYNTGRDAAARGLGIEYAEYAAEELAEEVGDYYIADSFMNGYEGYTS